MTYDTYTLEKDLALRARAEAALPAGVYGHMNSRIVSPAHPQFISRAEGGRIWDTDGNEYIDFICSYGTNLLGHHHPKVDEAARKQQALADCTSGPSPLIVELAEKFNEKVAHADWSLFAKNGGDATTICVSAARAQTGRKTVLLAAGAYHGATPAFTPMMGGVIESDRAYQLTYDYNDIDSLNNAVAEAGDDLAAILVSPFKHDSLVEQELPTQEFAEAMRAICDKTGAALILDDVRCAFRFSSGSTWETINVLPDLCAMSKSVANGYALSVVTGNNKFRDGVSQVYATGSFWFAAVSYAASLATIAAIEEEDVINKLKASGTLLRDGLNDLANSYGFKLNQSGPVQMPLLMVEDDPKFEKGIYLCSQAAQRGVWLHPWHNMFICSAHEEKDIKEALDRVDGAFQALRKEFGEG